MRATVTGIGLVQTSMFSTCLAAEKQGNRNIVVSPFGDYYAPTQPRTTESKVSYNMTTNPDYYTPKVASELHIDLNTGRWEEKLFPPLSWAFDPTAPRWEIQNGK